jgi:hypothetical protein
MRWDRLGALSGVLFVALIIISFIVMSEPPDVGEPVTEIVDYYVDNDTEIYVGTGMAMLAVTLFLVFANYLRRLFSAAGEAPFAALVLVGASILAIAGAIDSTISVALAEEAENLDPTSVQTLQALWDNDWIPFALGILVFMGATGVSILQTGVLPRWLGWIALLLFVLSFTPIGFVAFPAGGLWVLVVSIMLAMRGPSEPPAPTAAARTPA